MNSKLLLGLVVILAGLGVGWYVLRGENKPSSEVPVEEAMPVVESTPAPTEMVVTTVEPTGAMEGQKGGVKLSDIADSVVTYTDTGFAPSTVTVKKGTSVTFINGSSGGMWVASAVHPTHQLLPGFDHLKSVAKGGAYGYTFTKVGTWKYHNHVNPSDTGTVAVTE